MDQGRIRVVIADDISIVRAGLKIAFDIFDDIELVGEASNGKEAIQLCEALQPHVLLTDLIMPVMDGVAAIRYIHRVMPNVQCIVLTSFPEQELIQEAMNAGAVQVLFKNVALRSLEEAIRLAYADTAPSQT